MQENVHRDEAREVCDEIADRSETSRDFTSCWQFVRYAWYWVFFVSSCTKSPIDILVSAEK
jgi:hypothetical protein